MGEILVHGNSSESTRQELSYEYQHDRVWIVFKESLHPCALDKSSFSIGRFDSPPETGKFEGSFNHLFAREKILIQFSFVV